MEKKLSFTDITSGDVQGLMKTYKIDGRKLEQEVMRHAGRDIPQSERRALYHDVYSKHRGRVRSH